MMGDQDSQSTDDNTEDYILHENFNLDLCVSLTGLAEYEKNTNRNMFKYNIYTKAARVLTSHPKKIESGEEAKALNGIGNIIAARIDEFLQTGQLQKLQNVRRVDKSTVIDLFTRISGIGPREARELVEYGITTIEELKEDTKVLTNYQRIGLKYMEDFEMQIPREEIQEIEEFMKGNIAELDDKYEVIICGDYRRGKLQTDDIDVLIAHPSYTTFPSMKNPGAQLLQDFVTLFQECELITDVICLEGTNFMGACKLRGPTRRLDIRIIPYNQFYCTVLHLTGSDKFNRAMRAHALKMNYILDEYSLRLCLPSGMLDFAEKIKSEAEIFLYLDYPYTKPADRNW